jgi:hypothetical protein
MDFPVCKSYNFLINYTIIYIIVEIDELYNYKTLTYSKLDVHKVVFLFLG